MIDYSSYPHIIDHILSLSARPELLVVRQTSHVFRDKADALLAAHVAVRVDSGRVVVEAKHVSGEGASSSVSNLRLPALAPFSTGADGEHAVLQTRVLPHVRTFDLDHSAMYPLDPDAVALAARLPRVHTFRGSYDTNSPTTLLTARVRRGRSSWSDRIQLVINVCTDVWTLHLAEELFTAVQAVFAPLLADSPDVVILYGAKRYAAWSQRPGGPDSSYEGLRLALASFVAQRPGLRVALVGFDGIELVRTHTRTGDEDEDKYEFVNCPRLMRSPANHDLDVAYYTRKEYRSLIGLQRYAAQTTVSGDIWSFDHEVILLGPAGRQKYKVKGATLVKWIAYDYCIMTDIDTGRSARMSMTLEGETFAGEANVLDMGLEHGDHVQVVEV